MKSKNLTWVIITLVLLQTFLIVLLNLSYYVRQIFPIFTLEQTPAANLILSFLLLLTSMGMIYVLFSAAGRDMQLLRQELYIDNLKESLKNLRTQRHDFISHLQTVYGLLQLNMADAALEYITSVCNEVRQPTRIIEVNQPVLAALFQAKAAAAEARGINFQYEINSDLKGFLLSQTDATSIFGNLLDNAIEATLAALPGTEKRIWLRIFNAGNYYCFEVGNTGPVIPLELQKKIFERGFTTKKVDKENHGQGLYIVQKLVAAHNGRIEVRSSDQGTVFTVKFPILSI
ncbi:sensor histidine kinase [Neomoorella mulderi]|uniref:histidine kinase n=1 Tax=Moorella mulderi DSM 14980 TaxID=1122241 RepID=A0A151AXZ1_9FIRM|nr:ATP-binding protein [Moorella mulderi]KYH32529.1 sensor histidine kinase DpiB [Moorella mulderi DSM 14980]